MTRPDGSIGAWLRPRNKALLLLLGGMAVSGIFISCTTVERTVMAPPAVPGAKFVGSAACAECHDDVARDFKTASHARLQAKGKHAEGAGCESCHGPGSIHAEAGGGADNIVNPKKSPQVCFDCHQDKRGEFQLTSHHPVPEGRQTCTTCHDSHKGSILKSGGAGLLAANDKCMECHNAQRGPHVFEHEALREGCTTCHRPHGSVNAKLLTERNANLCLKCHFRQQTAGGTIMIGGWDHTSALQQGTCWSAGCHEAVHGSQVNSSLRF